MATVLNRTTKRLLRSVPADGYPVIDWIHEPDISAVFGQPVKYWLITGDVVSLVDQATQDAIDAQEESDRFDSIADDLDRTQTVLRAFAEVMLDQLNTLRAFHSLPAATLAQLKSSVRSKL